MLPPLTLTPSTPPTPRRNHDCVECSDSGYLGWKTPAAGYALAECAFCACPSGQQARAHWQQRANTAQQAHLDRLFASAGIPAHFRACTLATLIERAGNDPAKQAAIEAAAQYIADGAAFDPATRRRKSGLLLQGPYGAGKTGILTPVLAHHVAAGKVGLWIEVYDFLGAVQQGYDDGDSNAKLTAAQHAAIILLDDLGDAERTKPESDDRRRLLYQLINYRHNNGLPMLITTNCDAPALAKQIGARTVERIIESCAWVAMGGRNLRMERNA